MIAEEWAPLAVSIVAAWPNSRFDEANTIAYFQALREFDAGYVAAAFARLVETSEHVPSIAKVVELVRIIRREAEPRRELPDGRGYITLRQWILPGDGDYRNGVGFSISPSQAVAILAGKVAARFTREELELADARWYDTHGI